MYPIKEITELRKAATDLKKEFMQLVPGITITFFVLWCLLSVIAIFAIIDILLNGFTIYCGH